MTTQVIYNNVSTLLFYNVITESGKICFQHLVRPYGRYLLRLLYTRFNTLNYITRNFWR